MNMDGITEDVVKALEPTIDKYMGIATKEVTSALLMQVALYTGITFIMLDLMTRRLKKKNI